MTAPRSFQTPLNEPPRRLCEMVAMAPWAPEGKVYSPKIATSAHTDGRSDGVDGEGFDVRTFNLQVASYLRDGTLAPIIADERLSRIVKRDDCVREIKAAMSSCVPHDWKTPRLTLGRLGGHNHNMIWFEGRRLDHDDRGLPTTRTIQLGAFVEFTDFRIQREMFHVVKAALLTRQNPIVNTDPDPALGIRFFMYASLKPGTYHGPMMEVSYCANAAGEMLVDSAPSSMYGERSPVMLYNFLHLPDVFNPHRMLNRQSLESLGTLMAAFGCSIMAELADPDSRLEPSETLNADAGKKDIEKHRLLVTQTTRLVVPEKQPI